MRATAKVRNARRLMALVVVAATAWGVFGLPASDAAGADRADGVDQVADLRWSDGEQPARAATEISERVIVVAEGETLWDLVLPLAPDGSDPHAWIAEVADHNGIEPGRIRPGDAVRIPSS